MKLRCLVAILLVPLFFSSRVVAAAVKVKASESTTTATSVTNAAAEPGFATCTAAVRCANGERSLPACFDSNRIKTVTNVLEVGLVAGGAALAFQNRASLAPFLTWNNTANAAGFIYLANKLMPDCLKYGVRRIPVARMLMNQENFSDKCVKTTSLTSDCVNTTSLTSDAGMPKTIKEATARYNQTIREVVAWRNRNLELSECLAMMSVACVFRDYVSCSNIAKAALVTGLVNLVMPDCVRKIAYMVPILRRFV